LPQDFRSILHLQAQRELVIQALGHSERKSIKDIKEVKKSERIKENLPFLQVDFSCLSPKRTGFFWALPY